MRRNVAWVAILLVVAALALPAAAAPAPGGTGGIHGVVTDSVTGDPFDTTAGGLVGVDVFNVDTMARTRLFISNSATSAYSFASLAPGYYKMRFRYWDAGDNLTRYRWYNDKANFGVAATIHVISGASLEINFTLKPMRGAVVSGVLTQKGTGLFLTSACYSVDLFEASGISIGFIPYANGFGAWSVSMVPAGRWTALAVYTTGTFDMDGDGTDDLFCGDSPAHLDTWFRGASGWPLHHANLVADAATFATAKIFTVTDGVPVVDVDIAMLPAPTCRGQVPTIFGTTLADTINGTGARDVISGLTGNDTINGLGGNDLICGDAGNDTLTGGGGLKDIAVGGAGTDTCSAETTIGCAVTP
jgi:hypothetical protein